MNERFISPDLSHGDGASGLGRHAWALALTLALAFPVSAADPLPGPVPAVVVRVVDGDTLVVRARIWVGQEVETAVRVDGIDAPERRHCPGAAERARERLVELAGGRVVLRGIEPDKYGGRVRARVAGEEGDVGERLLAEGLARRYDGKGPAGWCP